MKTLTYLHKIVILLMLFTFSTNIVVNAQKEEEEIPAFMDMKRNNFSEIQRKAERYFSREEKKSSKRNSQLKKEKDDSSFFSKTPNILGRPEDNAYQKYKRWEWYWKDRINPDGSFHDNAEHFEEYLRLQKQKSSNSRIAAGPNWVNINQTTTSGGYNGMGRAVSVAFHPTDANTYFVGAPIGGVWKTSDGGNTYSPLTDALPYVSAGSIVVNYKKSSTLYISVGSSEGWWNWSLGIYKSFNNGATWSVTGLNWTFTDYRAIKKIVMSPTDTSILFAATTNGLYRTTNSGVTWTIMRTGDHSDVIYKLNQSNATDGTILFTSNNGGDIFRSTDSGVNWTSVYTSGGDGVKLSVTAANPNLIAAAHYGPSTVVYSTNLGNSFTTSSGGFAQNPDIFFVSQTNASTFYYGGVDVFKSTNSGNNWTQITHWCCPGAGQTEVHADYHYVGASPLNPSIIYFGNDGGVYKYNESTQVWTERTNGLITTQYYKIATAQNNTTVMIGGTQDNGGRYRQANGVWTSSNGGDAMEQAIDPTNYNIMYSTYVNGQLYRTTNAWGGFTEITPNYLNVPDPNPREVGDWVTPYVLDPNNSQTIVAGYKDVWRSTNRGTNWTQISFNLTGGQNLNQVAVSPGNSSIIYASRGTTLWKTTNGGANWNALTVPDAGTGTDPWGVGSITSIAISNTNANNIWISRSGYNAAVKVYKSTNQGASWTNISSGLPNVPANCLVYENSTNDGIYVGTDAGVFYRNAASAGWSYFGQGMPNTAITDLEIQYSSGKLRAGTHGRGVWETDVVGLPVSLISFSAKTNPDNKSVFVNWTTASEKNNAYFLVERSENGTDFTVLTKIMGNGTTNDLKEYSYIDNNPISGKNYYRLTQVDFDGETDNSQIVIAYLLSELEVSVKSSLFTDYFEIEIFSTEASAHVELIDVKGKSVFNSSVVTNSTIQLGAGLAKGIYVVKISTEGGRSVSKKVVKE